MPALVLAYALATLVAATPARTTTYAGAGAAARVGDLAAGLGLIAAGLLAWGEPRARRLGTLSLLAGVVWYAPDWEGWTGGSPLVRSLGATAAPFLAPLVLHIVLGLPSGRLQSWWSRAAALCGYAAAAVAGVGLALFRDPFYDLYCWRNCTANAFLVHRDQALARTLTDVWVRASLVLALAIVASALVRLARRKRENTLPPVIGASTSPAGSPLSTAGSATLRFCQAEKK